MAPDVSLWPLLGVAVIIAGFVLRFSPMIVVIAAAVTTALIAKFGPLGTLAAIGAGFLKTRNLTLALILPLATIGLLSELTLAYKFKFLWAPFLDQYDPPVLGSALGRRRGWLITAILAVMAMLAPAPT